MSQDFLIKHSSLLCLMIAFISSSAYSNPTLDNVYLGSKLSWSYVHNACEPQQLSCDKDMLGGGIYGGVQWNKWIATEIGYLDFGDVDAVYPALMNASIKAPYSSEIKGIEFSLKPSIQINDKLTVFGKVGALAWQNEVKGREIDFDYTKSEKGWDALFGLGTEYALNDQWFLRAEFQQFPNLGGHETGRSNISMLSAGITYRFITKQKNKVPTVTNPHPVANKTIQNNHNIYDQVDKTERNKTELTNKELPVVLFGFDSYSLSDAMKNELNLIVGYLKEHPNTHVLASGYTDGIGTDPYNKALSIRRATAVKNYLTSQGIETHRIQVEGLGARSQVANNKTDHGRMKNRRVVLTTWINNFGGVKI
ncbi:OmpA family protein [Vibrio algarum]|uniref:OmpA family protein n=1 Tax=Vibrio algarum TaxID=3020714 RepID=A0ABT4YV85_9VIBR|nr:OmpA family protein [Vibrio sp. KJ40-1]MDB1125487.1 OmpA family protein [Vibrio sp. KJ40-1]